MNATEIRKFKIAYATPCIHHFDSNCLPKYAAPTIDGIRPTINPATGHAGWSTGFSTDGLAVATIANAITPQARPIAQPTPKHIAVATIMARQFNNATFVSLLLSPCHKKHSLLRACCLISIRTPWRALPASADSLFRTKKTNLDATGLEKISRFGIRGKHDNQSDQRRRDQNAYCV